MNIIHLTASRFFGGPERQMLGFVETLPKTDSSAFVSFSEGGCCREFLNNAREAGFKAISLKHDTPRLLAARRELTEVLRQLRANVLLCHGYKADILGLLAGRTLGIPVIAVSRGWTGECFRICLYEAFDRRVLRWMNKVVCVSAAQAEKVRRAGVRQQRIAVIHNAIRPERFDNPNPAYRNLLCRMFSEPPARIVGAAGRLSPEKGFDILIAAAAQVLHPPLFPSGRRAGGEGDRIGFILFGDGPLRDALARQITAHGLENRFILAGFCRDLDRYLPHLDVFVQSSFTEGLPNVILEAQAAGVPVVATSVGGTPEVIEDGQTGWLVPPGDATALAERITRLLADDLIRARFSRQGRANVEDRFSFTAQSQLYKDLFAKLPGKFPAAQAASLVEPSAGRP